MNIFVLDKNPADAAKYHCDKHVVKMILETAQLLASAHWMNGGVAEYKLTHKNHPCSKWVRECSENYNWLHSLGMELCREYTFRYGKTHKTERIMKLLGNKPNLPVLGSMTEFPKAMSDELKLNDVVESYRNYYIKAKNNIAKWNKTRTKPEWYNI